MNYIELYLDTSRLDKLGYCIDDCHSETLSKVYTEWFW